MMVNAESAQEWGLSAGMGEIAVAHGEAAETVWRMKAWPDAGTGFTGGPRRRGKPQSGNYGAQIWDPLRRNAWLGTFGTAEDAAKAYDAAAVELHGAAAKTNFKSPAAVRSSASLTVVKEETAQEHGLSASNREIAEEHGDGVQAAERGKKRERTSECGAAGDAWSGEMMRFFEVLVKQETMQHRFVETIEKPEQDRMIREEAWRRQEMARLAREQEILAQERAMASTRDASVLSFIQKITGQTFPMPSMPPSSSRTHAAPISYAAAALPSWQPPPLVVHRSCTDIVMMPAETPHDASGYGGSGGGSGVASSSRWTNAEVDALIQLRCELETRRTGPNGPLWDEISAGMRRMGYSRSSKRCWEKWWNMHYYFKKVKESNKKRPEDSKTPHYFHQFEAFYRNKAALGSPAAPRDRIEAFTVAAPMSQMALLQPLSLPPVDKYGGNGHGVGGFSGGTQTQASNRFVFSEAGGHSAAKKVIKPERSVHSRVATGGTYMWYPAPTADDIVPEHVQEIGLKQAPVAAKVNSNVEVRRRAESLSGFRGVRLFGGKYYLAQIMEPGRSTRRLLGIFNNVDEATRAYDAAALRLYGTAAKNQLRR
ncbi:unnamed protein product [Alopecurus aequalis]